MYRGSWLLLVSYTEMIAITVQGKLSTIVSYTEMIASNVKGEAVYY